MRKWNKLLATLLAMVMVFGLTATAFAADSDKPDDTTTPVTDKADDTTPAGDADKKDDTTPAGDATTPADDADKKDDAAPADDADKKDDAAPADDADKDDAPSSDSAPATPTTPAPDETKPAAVSFSDVEEGRWYYDVVQKMVAAGIIEGYTDGTFKPNANVTWGAAVKMVVVFATGEEKAAVEGGNWASGYIAYLKDQGIWTEEIDHNATITRVEMCQLIAKTLKIAESEKESTFPDTTDAYVMALVDLGVIKGLNDGKFNPDGALTRAALCQMLATIPDSVKNGETTAPADGDDTTPADDADKKDETTPADDADKKDDTTPADDADKKDDTTPADDAGKKDDTTK